MVSPFAGGNRSQSGLFTAMLATFSPGTDLIDLASACGVSEFDWQQVVTSEPLPFTDANGAPLNPKFYDPPPANWDYVVNNPVLYAEFLDAYPFYYNQNEVFTGCAIDLGGGCNLPITSGDHQTLNFFDSPRVISQPIPAGNKFAFMTSLVGILPSHVPGSLDNQWNTYFHLDLDEHI
jgi:hypothetical protein